MDVSSLSNIRTAPPFSSLLDSRKNLSEEISMDHKDRAHAEPETVRNLKVQGFRAGYFACGIKKTGGPDLALILSDVPAQVAGMFTTNKVKAAPVLLDELLVKKGAARGVVVNSGNANACTGKAGYKNAVKTAALVEKAIGLKKGDILVSSTGVIGVPLPIDKIEAGVSGLVESLSYEGLVGASRAIMTTDAFPKTAVVTCKIGARAVTIAAIAKGAGMICPNMATMLAYFVTDASIKSAVLKKALSSAVEDSFNSIVVDNDTSTNDTVLAFANGLSLCPDIKAGSPEFRVFQKALTQAATTLAHMVVKDGEGATHFIELFVAGAASVKDARRAGKAVAGSFLVKTAFFGGDPNWGRILAALGRADVKMSEEKVEISINGVPVVRKGLDTGKEKEAAKAMRARDVSVRINLGSGACEAKVWTTDLSYEYVKINSAYRT